MRLAVTMIIFTWLNPLVYGQAVQAVQVKTITGQTEFFSKAAGPAQDIYAIDKTGAVTLDLLTGEIEVKIEMKNFTLPKSLMQKHYNERYMQTDRYPNSIFKGKIKNWDTSLKDGTYKVGASGDFTVHGVTRKKELQGTLTKKGNQYTLAAAFEVQLKDHGIEIPTLFFTEITQSVKVTVLYNLKP